jgi:hypothetical protein
MKTIYLRMVSETLNAKEMKNVKGGFTERQCLQSRLADDGGGGNSSPKQEACKGAKEGDRCIWTDANGVDHKGRCLTLLGPRHCSDLA